ncbi:hypothetical protein GCM10007385_32750 [Tateyamaria omphalii]|uniref:hypothetical protein n=1 Tax=Tateyamaria omphalii TaxID=299262 RepID=UPI001671CA71|nr:hypothetical protein [Tateyamaria omphalii]GGX60932.1 hypothetical protein GCM10007385_32750 [Tateyamaria omphalii]
MTYQTKRVRLGLAVLSILLLAGCADVFLQAARKSGPLKDQDLRNYTQMRAIAQCPTNPQTCFIDGAIRIAFYQADAFAAAARNTQTAQDLLSFGLLRAAGLVASGAAAGASDEVLVERAISAVGVQQMAERYTPRSAVQALYTGASRMNCIALAGSLYEEVNLADLSATDQANTVPVRLASFTMVLAMREVEYRTLYGTSRNVEDFSNLISAFEAAVESAMQIDTGVEPPSDDNVAGEDLTTLRTGTGQPAATSTALRQNPALERFFRVVSGCLGNADIQPDLADP